MKAIKFGGTSMSTVSSINHVKHIIESDPARRFVVVSAPGKAEGEEKITDLLIAVYDAAPEVRVKTFAKVSGRLDALCVGLGLKSDFFAADYAEIIDRLPYGSYDYIVSRGEYLCAKMLAALIGYEFIDATELIRFRDGIYDDEYTETVCKIALKDKKCAVIPGFYGADGKGDVVAFSRGGSDISGAIVARAVGA